MPPNRCYLHLRRIAAQKSAVEPGKHEQNLILLDALTKFGRNPDMVDIVLTSAVYSNMISRNHAEIVGKLSAAGKFEKYSITDHSLNGTYINDRRISGAQELREGDIIKFGHMNGAAVKAGMSAPQANAEFAFIVERAIASYEYLGFAPDGTRIRSLICKGNADILVEVPGGDLDRKYPDEIINSRSPTSAASKTTAQAGNSVSLPGAPHTNGGVPSWPSSAGFPYPQQVQFNAFQYLAQMPHPSFMMNSDWAHQLAAIRTQPTANGLFLQTSNASTANALAFGNAGYQVPSSSASFLPSSLSNTGQSNLSFGMPANNAALMSSLLQQHQLPSQPTRPGPGIPHQIGSNNLSIQHHEKQEPQPSTVSTSNIPISRVINKPAVASPPMECDSSVPSPPKSMPVPHNIVNPQFVQKPNSPKTVISEDQRSEKSWSMVDSPPPPRAPAPSHANRELSRTPSPKRDTPERIEREQREREQREREEREREEREREERDARIEKERLEEEEKIKEQAQAQEREQTESERSERQERQKRDSTSSGKGHKKSNELGRLLVDLDGYMSMNSRSEKRKSIDGKDEKTSKEKERDQKDKSEKEKKTKEKEKKAKEREREKEKEKKVKERPREPVKLNKLMKQLSEPSSSSDDSVSDEEKKKPSSSIPKKKEVVKKRESIQNEKNHKKELIKRRAPTLLSSSSSDSESGSDESDSSHKKMKKKKTKRDVSKEKKIEKTRKSDVPKEVKKRGRKPKARQESLSDAVEEPEEKIVFHDPQESCAMGDECEQPSTDNVNWVGCDDCLKWFHTICILGREEPFEEENFNCGCKPKGKPTKKRKG